MAYTPGYFVFSLLIVGMGFSCYQQRFRSQHSETAHESRVPLFPALFPAYKPYYRGGRYVKGKGTYRNYTIFMTIG
jgi:hypothetical protein